MGVFGFLPLLYTFIRQAWARCLVPIILLEPGDPVSINELNDNAN
jgi:hypothetical protein